MEETDKLKENLKQQLSELEMLQSAYCNPDEIQLDDYALLIDIHDFIQDKSKTTPNYLSFNVNLMVDNIKFQLCVTLPSDYPDVLPEVFVRVNEQNRSQQNKINSDLKNFISELVTGEICIFSIVSWIQENLLKYIDVKETNETERSEQQTSLSRYWIYSHHIYSKIKRREILKLADEFTLTGFSLPGKPGVMCLEGYTSDCNSCWMHIKAMNWQKIVCKYVETVEEDLNNFKKFDSFNELIFNNEHRSNHMDMGEFLTYLEEHNCSYIFKELFGLDGKTTSHK